MVGDGKGGAQEVGGVGEELSIGREKNEVKHQNYRGSDRALVSEPGLGIG